MNYFKADGGRVEFKKGGYGMSPGRSQAQYGHAGHAGKTEPQAQRDQRQGRDTPEQYQHITGGGGIEAVLESHRGPYVPPIEKAFGPPLPEGFRTRNWHPMFSTTNERKQWERIQEIKRIEDQRQKEEELLNAIRIGEGDEIRHGS